MSASQPIPENVRRPARLLTQNSEMRQIGVWNWSLPAWAGRLADGLTYNTCPSAGICAQACYARSARNFHPALAAWGDSDFDLYDRRWSKIRPLTLIGSPKW